MRVKCRFQPTFALALRSHLLGAHITIQTDFPAGAVDMATDRASFNKEIARTNGKPEWEGGIRDAFAQRWIDQAQPDWYVRNTQEKWVKK